ncbi:glycosyltransferase family 2 protein [Methanospirillum sp. J.3.6.1-F.2.7.3]|uniref:Glycosyltransferase family 2 protein n=1 Tax=Methanospirillum purgamenti TaxID=2834276 RepID=A0A8E7B1B8_9EURY|nr:MULTISPECIES: glycosyltransferase family 2 protein [Methanospirillum]MDX8549472.1 glycosyltransferase family 2 protein [Methanospirillum hungatei]QVV89246.1 glycosyltransferase family 2 protein [Methanospirillum sp. J.3.6.1-F.2.7.3]
MISVLIPNFNGLKYLYSCLESVYSQTYTDFEIIVIDNASHDESVEYIQHNYPMVRIIANNQNKGFSGAINDGIQIAQGEYIFLLNNDTIIRPDCLSNLISATRNYPNYHMYAAKMIYPDGRINSAGICFSISGAAWDRGSSKSDGGEYSSFIEVLGPSGGAGLYRKELFSVLGGFDPDFFMYMEDVDFALRARLSGYSCLYVPNVEVIHYHGGTAGVGTPLAVYYGNRNLIWCTLKNMPVSLLFLFFPIIFFRSLLVFIYYIGKGMGNIAFQARVDALKEVPRILTCHRKKQKNCSCNELIRKIYPFFRI